MVRNIEIDIETLGTDPNSVILSIGAVQFDEVGLTNPFHVHICPESCEAAGLTMDARTVLWWLEQSKEAQESIVSKDQISLKDALTKLSLAFNWQDAKVWSNGIDFDLTILENAFKKLNMVIPWKYFNKMDYRTLKKLVPDDIYKKVKVEPSVKHNALFDAYAQAETTQNILRRLGFKLYLPDVAQT